MPRGNAKRDPAVRDAPDVPPGMPPEGPFPGHAKGFPDSYGRSLALSAYRRGLNR